jgi:hypothetical protein
LQSAASGVARFDNNPTTGESLGLLIEESRTNLVNYSSQFDNAAWSKSNATVTADTIVAPDGTLTGDKLIGTAASGIAPAVFQAVTVSNSTVYTWSVYAKAAEYSFLMLKAQDTVSGTNPTWFNLSNGTVGTNSAGNTSTITSVGNGWYRCTVSRTTSSTSAFVNIQTASADNSATLTGDGFSGMFIWGAQLEAGAFATSYIPTVASQVTRAADAASMTGTNFSTWYNQVQGTIYVDANYRASSATSAGLATLCDTGLSQQWLALYTGTTSIDLGRRTNGTSGSGITASHSLGTINSIKGIASYGSSTDAVCVNGGTVSTATTLKPPPANVELRIGTFNTGGNPTTVNGTIKKLSYYPLAVTSAQLQALTS